MIGMGAEACVIGSLILTNSKEGEVGTVKMKFWGGSQSFSEGLNRYE